MIALTKTQGKVTSLRTYVGAKWKVGGADVTQLGVVGAPEAVDYVLSVAESGDGKVAEQAIFPATLTDNVTPWPRLLRLARNESRSRQVRKQAIFWLGQSKDPRALDYFESVLVKR